MELMNPFHAFRFHVAFREHSLDSSRSSSTTTPLCSGSFSECSGLEATMTPKVINEGGRNYGQAQRAGRVTFGTLVLRRGLTANDDLWRWFELVNRLGASAYRLAATLSVYGPEVAAQSSRPERALTAENGQHVVWQWELRHCLPIKFKAPDLSSTSSQIAIEELHLAHEGLYLLD